MTSEMDPAIVESFSKEAEKPHESRAEILENFYKDRVERKKGRVKRVTLDELKELKEKGLTTEAFLDYVAQKQDLLLHGSIYEITGNKIKPHQLTGKVFASEIAAIAIMRSLYTNRGVNLEYPYFINEEYSPLSLTVHIDPEVDYAQTERGFVYLVKRRNFKNRPSGSWQYIKRGSAFFSIVVETEKEDFKYPVKLITDLDANPTPH